MNNRDIFFVELLLSADCRATRPRHRVPSLSGIYSHLYLLFVHLLCRISFPSCSSGKEYAKFSHAEPRSDFLANIHQSLQHISEACNRRWQLRGGVEHKLSPLEVLEISASMGV